MSKASGQLSMLGNILEIYLSLKRTPQINHAAKICPWPLHRHPSLHKITHFVVLYVLGIGHYQEAAPINMAVKGTTHLQNIYVAAVFNKYSDSGTYGREVSARHMTYRYVQFSIHLLTLTTPQNSASCAKRH
jgi:hypothetical protein